MTMKKKLPVLVSTQEILICLDCNTFFCNTKHYSRKQLV
jgi:hypothetical protein